ncbi:MAG: accessory gene regulator ArgB-like protein [Mediterraneibacter gnavus]|jgi:accessory gene regulator B
MKCLSERLTDYVIKTGVVSEESYAIYQYGFQIGIEMLSCFLVCFGIAIYLRMIPEFLVFTGSFMLLRTYAGGVHLNSFTRCFICSVFVQTLVLLISKQCTILLPIAWVIILCGSILVCGLAPVENINRELDKEEKAHCKKVTVKILSGIIAFTLICTLCGMDNMVSLISMIILVVLISQYIGIEKYKIEKKRRK